jgi:cob(I)alamin adenosyltransferase
MGHRLSRIYTRTGDRGTTGLGDGSRIAKDTQVVEAMGEVDELNSVLGLLLAEDLPQTITTVLIDIQHDLFDLGAELSTPGHRVIAAGDVEQLEQELDALNSELSPLKEFILPGGTRPAALCHFARTVCRRAERRLVRLQHEADVSEFALRYINRLSDLLFVLARSLNKMAGHDDVLWQPNRKG